VNPAARSGERALLAAGTKTYRHGAEFAEPLANLDRVPDALRWVVETLTGFGYQSTVEGTRKYLLNPSLQRLKEAVQGAAESAPVVVVYYTGHGLKPDRSPYYLVTAGAKPRRLADTALQARQLLDLVSRKDAHGDVVPDDEQPQVLIIIDCCFSGAGGIEALKDSLQDVGNPTAWVLASASSTEWALEGWFAAALMQALLDPEAGASQRFLGLDWIAEKINGTLKGAEQKARYFPPGGESSGLPPFFPNPKHIPSVAGLTIAEQHWMSRLRGVPADSTTAGFYVTGRTGRMRVIQDLAGWMRDPDRGGLAMVTGSPGSGKSAMLAMPVLLTDHAGRDALIAVMEQDSLVARASDLFDGLPVIGVHARGMNPYRAAAAIAKDLGRTADSPDELLASLDDRPEMSSRIIVIDAVDEARNPQRLLTDLLLPLARRPRLRVVVGTRRHVIPLVADTSLMIDLDSDNYRDPQALADYAHQLLVAAHEPDTPSPYHDRDDTAVTVAAGIAEKATSVAAATGQSESFLLAQLLARGVRGRPQVLDVTVPGWAGQLPADVGAAFNEDLRRLLGTREPAGRALLTALAWAQGPGLPWESIWVPVAEALANHTRTGRLHLDREDVRYLLDNAAAYIVEDIGPGQRSVFRPFHDLIAAHLRGQPSDEQLTTDRAAKDAWQQRRHQVERAITRALLGTVPATSDGKPDWELAHPYLRAYLADHAANAGTATLGTLAADLGFLAAADPVNVIPLLEPTVTELRDIARIYRRARPLLADDLRANVAYLQEAALAVTGVAPPEHRDGTVPRYHTRLAAIHRDDSLLTISGHTGPVASVAFGVGPEGSLLLASGGEDGTVRLWDPATGTQVGEPLAAHSGKVLSVAFGAQPDGRLLLASGGADGIVRLWDPAAGIPLRQLPTGHDWAVTSVAFGARPDGRLLLASGGSDMMVRLWDALTGDPVGEPIGPGLDSVNSVAFGTGPDGRLLLADGSLNGRVTLWDPLAERYVRTFVADVNWMAHSWPVGPEVTSVAFGSGPEGRPLIACGYSVFRGYSDGKVWQWDLVTGNPFGEPFTVHESSVRAVALHDDPDGRALLACGCDDETVRLWDLAASEPLVRPFVGHADSVNSVSFGVGPHGRLLLASGSDDWTVRLWDPVTDRPVGEPLAGHSGRVFSVAFGTGPDGHPLLGSGSGDGTVRLWDPAAGTQIGVPLAGHSDRVLSVAFGTGLDGRLLLASGSADGTVRLWDPATGEPLGELLTEGFPGHRHWVSSVAFGTGPHRRLLLASTDAWTVRLWDPAAGAQFGEPLAGHSGRVLSVAFGAGPDGRLLLASGSEDRTVRLWDPFTRESLGEPLPGHRDRVTSVAFGAGPGGRLLLASGSQDRTVRLWDPLTNVLVVTLHRRSSIWSVRMFGSMLAIGDDEGISVIEPELDM
jgi:WD40 repeat protein